MSSIKAAQLAQDELWDPSWREGTGEKTIKSRMEAKDPAVTLYSSWFCPFAQRGWIALEEAQVHYKWVEINPYEVNPREPGGYTKKALPLEEKRKLYPGFIEASPRGLVPAIRDNTNKDRVIWESMPVAEYVDAVYGNGSLLPRDEPYTCAMIQIWSAHCTERIQKAYYAALMAQEPQERKDSVEQFYKECRALAGAMHDSGPFFLGDRFSLVDVALAPFWQRFIWVGGHYFGLEFPNDESFARLERWWEATSKRPSVAATIVCKARLIASYVQYANNEATSDFAKHFRK